MQCAAYFEAECSFDASLVALKRTEEMELKSRLIRPHLGMNPLNFYDSEIVYFPMLGSILSGGSQRLSEYSALFPVLELGLKLV